VDQAVELVTATLAAERVVLPPTLRAALVAAARVAHTDLDVETALVTGAAEEGTRHRFDPAAAPGEAVCAVLTALPARRLAGCTLRLTWRKTPAGAAPGPLPRAVVLVEADPDRSVDVLAYLLATELDRAGAPASVEVFTAGRPLPAYHTAALRTARTVLRGAAEQPQAPAAGRHGAAEATSLFGVPDGPSGPDGRQQEGGPGSRPVDLFGPDDARPEAAEPRPAGRRRRPEPIALDGVTPGGAASESPGPAPSPPAVAAPTPGGAFEPAPDTDPLNGPLRVPLLAPLLDPTGVDPTALDPAPPDIPALAPGPTATAPERAGPRGADVEQATPAPPDPESQPEPPEGPAAVPAEWEEDWRSGEWAMPHTPRTGPADRLGPDGAFDVFGASGGTDPAAADLPRRTERSERLRRHAGADGSGVILPARPDGASSAGRDGGSLFESPTAQVAPSPGPRPSPQVNGGGDAAPPDTGEHPGGPLFPSAPGDGQTRLGRPARSPGDRPTADDPLFGPRTPDVPLFGGAPGPDGPAPEAQRPGRRRRPEPPPDAPTPFAAAQPAHVPAPSRPGDDPLLQGTEGDLLAQLQAELAARERRPRPYRRAERNGSAHTVNGHSSGPEGDRPPPDKAR
jgi:hypothetical protein